MAPEQLRDKPRPASDQYALAVVVYEWLSVNTLSKDLHQRFKDVQDFALALEEAYNAESAGRTLLASTENPAENEQSKPATRNLPLGTVTLLFTDIEGSTLLLQQLGDRYQRVLAECRQLLRSTFQDQPPYCQQSPDPDLQQNPGLVAQRRHPLRDGATARVAAFFA
jgi:hypothetical protein